MLIPLVGFDGSGEPLISRRISSQADDATTQPLEVVRRLGLATPMLLCMPTAVLSLPPSDAMIALLLEHPECIVGPFSFDHVDVAREWMNSGARYALFSTTERPIASSVKEALRSAALPAERIMLLVDAPRLQGPDAWEPESFTRFKQDVESFASPEGCGQHECCHSQTVGVVSGIVLILPDVSANCEYELLSGFANMAYEDRLQLIVGGTAPRSPSQVGELHRRQTRGKSGGFHVLSVASLADPSEVLDEPLPPPPPLPQHAAALRPLFDAQPLEVGACFSACVRTDRSDGLVPTVVQEADGVLLGFLYSSETSLRMAIREGRGVYWTRQKKNVWVKGNQRLHRIRLDCDSDALAFTVTQLGEPPVFCHRGSLSCWGHPTGLHALQLVLRDRKRSAPPGSYTKRLFEDSTLLRNKLVEEAQELAEATEPDHVAAEAADLIFFAMARCVAAGVGLAEIGSHLDRRSLKLGRRPGNAKASRIAAGNAILQQSAKGAAVKRSAAGEDGADAKAGAAAIEGGVRKPATKEARATRRSRCRCCVLWWVLLVTMACCVWLLLLHGYDETLTLVGIAPVARKVASRAPHASIHVMA